VQRLQFIRRAQELGFDLDDVAELVSLSNEPDKLRVREITQRRLAEIRQRVVRLEAMASAMAGLVGCCEQSSTDACPIIAALVDEPQEAIELRSPRVVAAQKNRGNATSGTTRVSHAVAG